MKARSVAFLLGAALLLSLSSPAFAGTTGKISGRVTDKKTGEGVPGANVILAGTKMGIATDPDGYFTIIDISPGSYSVSVRYIGYDNVVVTNIAVNVDRTTKLDIALPPSEGVQMNEVVIRGERPAIEKDRTHTAAVVSSQTIEDMPVTEVSEVIQMQAGVVAGSGGELHFRGGRAREVGYMIDGIPVTNSYNQDGGLNVRVENAMIQQMEVISGTFNAEYGSAQSGIVNIVTKGTESVFNISAKAYTGEWLSDQTGVFLGIDKINPFATRDLQVAASGPIVADQLGFSMTGRYSYGDSYQWYERRFMPLDGWKINAYQRWYSEHYAQQFVQEGTIYIPDSLRTGDGSRGPLNTSEGYSVSGKLTWAPVSALRLAYQLFASGSRYTGGDASRRYQPDAAGQSRDFAHQHFVTFHHAPSATLFYNLRFSYQHNQSDSYWRKDNVYADYPGADGIQPIGTSSNGFSLGNTGGFYGGKDGKNYRDLFLINGDINWQVDRYNSLKAGFELRQNAINTYSVSWVPTELWLSSQYTTSIRGDRMNWPEYWSAMVNYWDTLSIQKYRKVRADEVTRYRDYTIRPMEFAAYLQDKIELGEIIVNAGVRLDLFQPNEKTIINKRVESYLLGAPENLQQAPIQWQLSPRFGLSFPISAEGAFHVAYGHFFQMPSYEKIYNVPLNILTPLQLNGMTLGDAAIKPERTIAYEIGIQQGITSEIAVDVTAYYKDIRNLLGIERVITVDGIGYNRYINRDYGNVKGIGIGIRKEGRGFVTGSLSYTLQYANGSASDPDYLQLIETAVRVGGQPVQFVDRQILPLEWDQRHTLNGTVTFQEFEDWSISILANMGSGTPFSPTFIDRYDIPTVEYKNSSEKPFRWTVDLKARKMFKFGGVQYVVFLKVDNVFDHLNQNYVFDGSGTAQYNPRLPYDLVLVRRSLAEEGVFSLNDVDNRPQWYSAPRKIEIGIELNF